MRNHIRHGKMESELIRQTTFKKRNYSRERQKCKRACRNGTRYYLRVTAVDSAGNESAYSNEVNGAPNTTLGVEILPDQAPTNYVLGQNYPNPFNPSTTLQYGIPMNSRVRLQIYNVLGEVVAELVNGERAAGWYQVRWNANVSTGIYICRITAVSVSDPNNRFVQVKKMLLLK